METRKTFLDRLPLIALVVIAIGAVYLSLQAFHTRQTTGLLTVTSFNKQASVSVSQNNKNAVVLGFGDITARLTPGTYQVVATANGHFSQVQATITAQKETKINIPYYQSPDIVSPANISFSGFDALLDRGINNEELANIKNLFFAYNQNARVITLDESSIVHPYRDPDSDTPYTMNFSGTIDGTEYKATITEIGIDNIELTLFNPQTGSQIFDKSTVQSVPG